MFKDYEFAKIALTHYDHDAEGLDEALAASRKTSNMYRFFRDRELCFLRIVPKEEKDFRNLCGEMEFLAYLKDQGYPALEIILTKDNKTILELEGRYITAFQRVPGIPLYETEMNREIVRKYGEALGKLHQITRDMPRIIGKWDTDSVLGYIEKSFRENHAPKTMDNRFISLKKDIAKMEKRPNNYGLIHYDFELDNVFYDEKTNQCHVIDFDDSFYFFYHFDVMRALEELDDGEMKKEFLKSYQEVRKLTREEETENEGMEPVLQEFWDLYTYARLLHALSDQGEDHPDWKENLVQKCNKKLRMIESKSEKSSL